MTIFDSIRYPISNPPLWEQLDCLPPLILKSWAIRAGMQRNSSVINALLYFKIASIEQRDKHLLMLRNTILEWDNDNI